MSFAWTRKEWRELVAVVGENGAPTEVRHKSASHRKHEKEENMVQQLRNGVTKLGTVLSSSTGQWIGSSTAVAVRYLGEIQKSSSMTLRVRIGRINGKTRRGDVAGSFIGLGRARFGKESRCFWDLVARLGLLASGSVTTRGRRKRGADMWVHAVGGRKGGARSPVREDRGGEARSWAFAGPREGEGGS